MRYGGRLDNAAQDNDTFEQGGASAGEEGDIPAGEDGDVSAGEDKEERSHHGVVSMALSCADKTYIVFAYLPSYYSWTFGACSWGRHGLSTFIYEKARDRAMKHYSWRLLADDEEQEKFVYQLLHLLPTGSLPSRRKVLRYNHRNTRYNWTRLLIL